MPLKGTTLGKCGADMKHFGYPHYQSNSPVWKKVPFLMEKAENCMIYDKMSHLQLPWGSKATYKRKKYPAVQCPANWNFSAWKMRRVQDVQPPKHSRYSRTFHKRPPKMSSLGGRYWGFGCSSDWKRVIAWDKGIRVSLYGIFLGETVRTHIDRGRRNLLEVTELGDRLKKTVYRLIFNELFFYKDIYFVQICNERFSVQN